MYSCVSVIENGKPKAIHHDDGKTIVPSVVAYGNEILVGNHALNSNIDMSNILYDSKRLIGWEFLHNLPNAEAHQLWTFKVDTRDKCAGYVLNKGQPNERFLRPEEVSAEILKYLKMHAEKYLHQKVTGVVVTVPALFQDNQKAATERAVELAGLELKRLLHEPNSAAIVYNANHQLGNSKLLIFDFGGGTLDVSILEMIGNNVDVMALANQFENIYIDRSKGGATKQLKMPDFYDSQNEEVKMRILKTFGKYTDLDAFDKWLKNEEIEFKKPPTQEDMKGESTSQSIPITTTDSSPSNPHIKTITNEINQNPYIRDAIAIDIGTSKCRISICKDKYIQIVEHGNLQSNLRTNHRSFRSESICPVIRRLVGAK
ncbi:hypothetical protein WR25_05801 [Diploscapter pachys]|uniref:Uncharacterized protein n=1 Tax=Diploscapter pachys TaxID=2018661 RepID=A0A2A2JPH9_9BILA|nr:hypothetical protein WR25_05801 [Diploscapter pachys]